MPVWEGQVVRSEDGSGQVRDTHTHAHTHTHVYGHICMTPLSPLMFLVWVHRSLLSA